MFDPLKFFRPEYLFELRPFTAPGTIKAMMVFFALLVVIGIALKLYKETQRLEKYRGSLLEKLSSFFISLGVIGIGLSWLRYERVQILSARFWLIGWLILAGCWLYPIIKYWLKIVPQARKRSEEHKLYNKYLPGKK